MLGIIDLLYKRKVFKIFILGIFISLITLPVVMGKVTVESAQLKRGNGFSLLAYSTANFVCHLKNTDTIPHKFTLRLLPSQSTTASQGNYFSAVVTVLPKTELLYTAPVLVENSQYYRLDYFIDGVKNSKLPEKLVFRLEGAKAIQFAILTDDVSFGSLKLNPAFKFTQTNPYAKQYSHTFYPSKIFPNSWNILADYKAVIIADKKVATLSPLQIQAIKEYAKQGGTVVFCTPEAIMAAQKTPLRELLPVTPISIIQTNNVIALKKWLPKFKGFKGNYISFLNSIPKKDTLSQLSQGKIPYIQWKRYGLGSCRITVFPLLENKFNDKKDWGIICKRLLIGKDSYEASKHIALALDEMTGFTVPPKSVVKRFFFLYFLLIFSVFAIAFWKKKMGVAFLTSAVISILFTGYILNEAKKGKQGSGALGAVIRMSIKGGTSSPEKSHIAFFASKDTKLTVTTPNDFAMITGLIPFRAAIMAGGFIMHLKGEKAPSSFPIMTIQRENGRLEVKQLAIPENTAKQFTVTSTSKHPSRKFSTPELQYKNGMPTLIWDVPKGETFEAATLSLPSGHLPLKRIGDKLTLAPQEKRNSSRIIRSLFNLLSTDAKKWTPAIALIKRSNQSDVMFSTPATIQGYDIALYPITRVCKQKEIFIPAEDILLTAGSKSTRMSMIGNMFKGRAEQPVSQSIFRFTLPPEFKDITPTQIDAEIVYINVGGNIRLTPALRLFNSKTGRRENSVKYTAKEGDHYLFKFAQIGKAINHHLSFGELIVSSSKKDNTLSFEQGMRANKWEFKGIKLTIKGTLPNDKLPLKY